ncbi:ABC transporter ATP-binding protein [Lactiplantibacillus sp. WILCCON 0030]|uniref:ABC transporter ATP-binding protein n=1 Tax=Lactiplantibacillus brownii TaxID=3069269 RepID=A0ABU1A5F6_9LACO|nr:ABC transporter ATP-binding protein [Lactiplantibacillus brownii]MDQ7936220.1 ABC transporter ATP-binding protein [Lactiplantibacillus brownii]
MANIALENLSYTYPEAQAPTLNHVNLTFKTHQFTLLTGPSGTGKSTLLKLMTGLMPLPNAQGVIRYDGQDLASIAPTERANQVALMFQNPNQQFAMDTVENELIFALENQQVAPAAIDSKITTALNFVGISALRQRQLNHLSGGEKQKVALAVIVAMDSDVILLDEPFASVDPAARASLLKRLVQLRDQAGKTIILADHDLTDYATLVDQVVQITPTRQLTTLPTADWPALFAAFARANQPDQLWPLPTNQDQPLFHLQQVALEQGRHQLLQPTDLTLWLHRNTLITGPNGSGKSTLFESLVRLTSYTGQITYLGDDIQRLRRKRYARQVALLFQDAETQFLTITVAEELAQSQKYAYGNYFTSARITAAMQQLNLVGHEDQVIYTLSEGQKKKLQILLMLIMQSPVLLMDEPLKGLDLKSVQALVALLQNTIAVTQQSLVIISHQLTGLTPLIDYHLRFDHHQLQYRGALR